MRRLPIAGGWYAAARPGGQRYAALVRDKHIQTEAGIVPLPPGPQNLLWLDLAADGSVAGIGGRDDQAWLRLAASWTSHGRAWGPRSVIFDASGALRVAHDSTTEGTGALGWIQVADDGRLVPTSEHYIDAAHRLYEYTTRGDITIGQGGAGPDGDDPLVARLPDGSYRLLQSGRCRAVRFYRDGDDLAVAWSQEDQEAAGVLWLTVQELAALPPYDRTPRPDVPRWPARFRTGVFFRARGGTIDRSVPCDCEVAANGWGDSGQGPVIAATLADAQAAGGRLLALYEDSTGGAWNLASIRAKHAAHPTVPVILNYDGDASEATWPALPAAIRTVKSIECYPLRLTESAAATVARVEAKARAVLRADQALVLVRCTYLQQGNPNWTLDQVLALQPLHNAMLARLLADFPQASITSLSFAWLRDIYGASAIPELAAWVRAEAAAMPAGALKPLAPAEPPAARPRVTIASYSPTSGLDGFACRAVAQLSGGPADRLHWLLDGHVVADNPATDHDHTFTVRGLGAHQIGVEVVGPGGSDRTGQPRVVTVVAQPAPPPAYPQEPPPMPPTKSVHIVAFDGRYVTAELGGHGPGYVTANRQAAGPWETWDLITLGQAPDGAPLVALRAHDADGPTTYLAADGNGGGLVHAASTQIGPAEHFALVAAADGTVAFRTFDGQHYLCADHTLQTVEDKIGGPPINATRTRAASWEHFRLVEAHQSTPPPEPPSGPAAEAIGPLDVDGMHFRSGGAIVKVRGVTAFTALQDWLAGKSADLERYFDWARALGPTNVARVFGTWVVTGFDPRKYGAKYYDGLDALAAWLGARGFRLHYVALTDQQGTAVTLSHAEQDAHVKRSAEIVRAHHGLFELVNEDWKNGKVAHRFSVPAGTIATRSAWPDGNPPTYAGPLLSFTTEHTPRDDQWMRKAKNLFETQRDPFKTGKPAIAGEPIGIYEHNQPGRRTADARACAEYFALAELMGAGAILHGDMSSLMACKRPGPAAQKCAEAVAAMWQAGIPPTASSSGTYTRGGLSSCPLRHTDRYKEGHEADKTGALRTFAMVQGSKATAVVVQPGAEYEARPVNGWTVERVTGPLVFLKR